MTLDISLLGAEEILARLQAFPDRLREDLAAKAESLSGALVGKVRDDKLNGSVLTTRSGALKASIDAEVSGSGDHIEAIVGSFGDIKYAAIQEYGGRTAAHEIVPDKADVLAFISNGAMRFARRVEHPGSVIPARSYLGSSLEDMRDEIVATLADAATRSWENS